MWIIQTLSLLSIITTIIDNHPVENWCAIEMAASQFTKPNTPTPVTELLGDNQ